VNDPPGSAVACIEAHRTKEVTMSAARRVFFLLATFALAAPLAAESLPSGFGGLRWGDAPSADLVLTGRAPFEKPRRTRFYMRKKDEFDLAAGVKVRSAEYVFREDRLVAVLCAVGSRGTSFSDSESFDALWGAHETDRDGNATWRGERTTAMLLRPDTTGAHGPVIALFDGSVGDAEIAEALRSFHLRVAGSPLAYRGGRPEVFPMTETENVNEQFKLDLQREQENSKVPK
jgi:hypothetical protein